MTINFVWHDSVYFLKVLMDGARAVRTKEGISVAEWRMDKANINWLTEISRSARYHSESEKFPKKKTLFHWRA
jgi:hypothetical protein